MNLTRRSFLRSGASLATSLSVPFGWERTLAVEAATSQIRLIRHATLIVRYGGSVLLVDPMLSDPGVMPPIDRSPNPRPNPLGPLSAPATKVLTGIDAVLVTHTHPDHWDAAARDLVPKDATIFIQPGDSARFSGWGFAGAQTVGESVSWRGIAIHRTGGQHGRGEVGQRLAPVSGYVMSRTEWPTVYVAGDTVWCPEVADAIQTHNPNIIVVNSGAAQFLEGGPITMDVDDVVRVCEAAPKAKVIAVHMEAINHCVLTRAALRAALSKSAVKSTVLIPRDGEELELS
jgi:L-ascorbate metabolism protein UlaG (beta-lactamase superfamily)